MHLRQLFFICTLGLVPPPAMADTYIIDALHAHVSFRASHLGLCEMTGAFSDISGALVYTPDDLSKSSVEIVIKTESLFSENSEREDALKGESLLSVDEYPEIRFKSTRIEKEDGEFHAYGNLKLHGTTRQVGFPFVLNGPLVDLWGNPRIGILADLAIDRRDYGLTYDRKLESGEPVVGDEVKISIRVEAVEAP